VLITSQAKRETALAALGDCPNVELCLIIDGPGHGDRVLNLDEAVARYPATPIADESLGTGLLYSSGTTGRPKGVLRALPLQPPDQPLPVLGFFSKLWRFQKRCRREAPAYGDLAIDRLDPARAPRLTSVLLLQYAALNHARGEEQPSADNCELSHQILVRAFIVVSQWPYCGRCYAAFISASFGVRLQNCHVN